MFDSDFLFYALAHTRSQICWFPVYVCWLALYPKFLFSSLHLKASPTLQFCTNQWFIDFFRVLASLKIFHQQKILWHFFTKAQQCSKSEKMHISFDLIRKIHFIFIRWHLRKRKMALTMRVGIDVAFFNASQLKTRFQMNKFIQAYKVENRHTQRQTGLYLRFHCSSISPSISVQSFLKRKIETLEAFTNVKLCRLSCTSPAARKESLIFILKYLNMLVLTKSDLS